MVFLSWNTLSVKRELPTVCTLRVFDFALSLPSLSELDFKTLHSSSVLLGIWGGGRLRVGGIFKIVVMPLVEGFLS